MAARLESWAKSVLANSRAKPPARLVLVTLAVGCSPDGICGIPLSRLADFTGLTKRGVQKAIDQLLRLGELRLEHPPKGRSRALYRIEIPRLYNCQSGTTRYSTKSVEWNAVPLKKADLLSRARERTKPSANLRELPANITPFPATPEAAEA